MTLAELLTAATVCGVIVLVGGATWEMSWRSLGLAKSRGETGRNAFGVLNLIQQETMRATTIEVPDPDYPGVDSMQLTVSTAGSSVRRAFRLSGSELLVDRKDEGPAPFAAFDGVSALSFTVLDPPLATQVQITCTSNVDGQQIQMQTVARKRN